MKRVALLEAMGGSNFKPNQGSSIYKKILHMILDIHVLIQQTHLNTSGKPGSKWISQWTNGKFKNPDINKIKTSYEYPDGMITDFSEPIKISHKYGGNQIIEDKGIAFIRQCYH